MNIFLISNSIAYNTYMMKELLKTLLHDTPIIISVTFSSLQICYFYNVAVKRNRLKTIRRKVWACGRKEDPFIFVCISVTVKKFILREYLNKYWLFFYFASFFSSCEKWKFVVWTIFFIVVVAVFSLTARFSIPRFMMMKPLNEIGKWKDINICFYFFPFVSFLHVLLPYAVICVHVLWWFIAYINYLHFLFCLFYAPL